MRKTIGLLLTVLFLFTGVRFAGAEQTVKAYCVLSPQTSKTISGFAADEAFGVAGLSKLPAILTLCFAADRGLISPETTVTVGMRASSIGGPSAYLKTSEQIGADALLRAAVMISAGDAIWALMEHAFGSEDVFRQNIELTLKEIGVEHEMKRALGTDDKFTCHELAMLGQAALNSKTFLKYCAEKYAVLKHADGRETELANANKLLTSLSGCIGLLTGSSKTDGYCGVFACKRKDTTFVCAAVGAPNSKARFETVSHLIEEAFANYAVFTLSKADEPVVDGYPVKGGDADTVDLYTGENVALLLRKSDGEPKQQFLLPDTLQAPLDPAFSVGSVSFIDANGTVLYELALYPSQAVSATGFREILKRILTIYANG
jgi:D-alanyl-D-alanine carboxypeptidase